MAIEQEAEVIERAKKDPHAFGRLYDEYYRPIFGFLLNRTGNVDVAKDLTSETFFHALKSIHRYKDQGKPFRAWLFAIAVAQIGNYYRAKRKLMKVTMEECPELVADEISQPDVQALETEMDEATQVQLVLLKKLMRRLNDKQQTILTLRYMGNHTIPEISDITGIKEGTVKSHIHRATKKLNKLMQEELKKPEYAETLPTIQSGRSLGVLGA